VLPGFLVMLMLSALYAGYRHLAVVDALFFGVKAAVLAVVVEALLRIARRALKNGFAYALAGASFLALFLFHVPFPLIVLGAAAIGLAASRLAPGLLAVSGPGDGGQKAIVDTLIDDDRLTHVEPSARRAMSTFLVWAGVWALPVIVAALMLGGAHVLTAEGVFFSKSAMVTFGGAYAVLAYVAQQAVDRYGWLGHGEMLDGLGLAETTPGPLILVLTFVGFLAAHRQPAPFDPMLAGLLGAAMTTWVTFAPSFLWIFLGAPYVEGLRGNKAAAAALAAITAAVVGVILNLTVWFALKVLFHDHRDVVLGPLRLDVPVPASLDLPALVLAAAAMVATLRFHVGMLTVLGACAAAGLAWRLA
jgi:chromate transporter